MLQEKIAVSGRIDSVDVAAVWPVSAQVAPVPIPEIEAQDTERTALQQFMRQGIDTVSGRDHRGAALIRMLILPLFLTLGFFGIALTMIS
jgi:hypothetical protein